MNAWEKKVEQSRVGSGYSLTLDSFFAVEIEELEGLRLSDLTRLLKLINYATHAVAKIGCGSQKYGTLMTLSMRYPELVKCHLNSFSAMLGSNKLVGLKA
jgi:hypothetical protein